MVVKMSNGPSYISWEKHGGSVPAPPGVFTGALAHAFVFESARGAGQHLADLLLNPAGGGRVRYETVVDRAFVTFMTIARCSAQGQVVWMPGRECAVWLPLAEWRDGSILPRLVVWAPYIFIDYALGLVTGREVWGWSKVLGAITTPADRPDTRAFSCSTVVFDDLSVEAPGRQADVVRVEFGDGLVDGARQLPDFPAAMQAVSEALFGSGRSLELDFAPLGSLPAIALKQFRDSNEPAKACYQALVNSPCQVTHFRRAGLGPDRGTLQFIECGSHHLASDFLGAGVGALGMAEVPVLWAGWLDFDFQALPGPVIR